MSDGGNCPDCEEQAGVIVGLRNHLGFVLDREADTQRHHNAKIEAQAAEIERLTINGIHTCHDECQRVPCMQRREIVKLRDVLREVTPPPHFGESEQNKAWWAKARAALGETK